MQIHQLLPNLSFGDAVGNLTFNLQNLFKNWGYYTDIFVQTVDKTIKDKVKHVNQLEELISSDSILIYHFSIGAGLSSFLKNLKCKKIVINHNITPPEYMKGLNDLAEHMIKVGLEELSEIVKYADLVLCDSEYNKKQINKRFR